MIPSEAHITERSQTEEQARGARGLLSALLKHHTAPTLPAIEPHAIEAAKLWYEGKDTLDIAKALNRPEHEIANGLPVWRVRYRQMQGGSNGG